MVLGMTISKEGQLKEHPLNSENLWAHTQYNIMVTLFWWVDVGIKYGSCGQVYIGSNALHIYSPVDT